MTQMPGGLDEALELTSNMLANAKDGRWEQVNELSSQRLHVLHAFFSTSVASEDAQYVAERIVQLQALDRQLLVLCDAQREEIGKQLFELRGGKKGAVAYLGNL